ncbi:MAG TPA: 3-dehydroquinate synthase [Bacteroidales bacterium]|nr:3-dehydroquinate synthase [Bacteroidales bacterium]
MKSLLTITETWTCPVFSGASVIGGLNQFISDYCEPASPVFVLVDENTRKHCLPVLLSDTPCLQHAAILEMGSGEEQKNRETAEHLWKELDRLHADRRSILINLGGGVVTDVGGFVAATFNRGIRFLHVPTTLMGMVDAAIGGKTGMNLHGIKNRVGLFALPEAVFIYPGFLRTLDRENIRSGLAEVVKYALTLDENLWKELEAETVADLLVRPYQDPEWEDLITRSVEIKHKVVRKDFFDRGYRRILNFGHTFGHLFESLSWWYGNGSLLHGNAVAMGMICECYLSTRLSGLKEKDLDRISSWILRNFGYFPVPGGSGEKTAEILERDKKRIGQQLNLTLLAKPGKAFTGRNCGQEMISEALLWYRNLGQ